MPYQRLTSAAVLTALSMFIGSAQAFDEAKYPDFNGQWSRLNTAGLPGQPSFDHTKPWGLGQQVPLTPEYQAILRGKPRGPSRRRTRR